MTTHGDDRSSQVNSCSGSVPWTGTADGKQLAAEVKGFALRRGADLAGIADLSRPYNGVSAPEHISGQFPRALSLGIGLPEQVVDIFACRPTPEYVEQYHKANDDANVALDRLAALVAARIREMGFAAEYTAASCLDDWRNGRKGLSHQAVAILAGLGWQGKSLLLISPQFGPRLRLTSVLTDMPLEPDAPIRNRCGRCTACADACPAGAIKGIATGGCYRNASDAVDAEKCLAQLNIFHETLKLKYPTCGVCISACPWAKKRRDKAEGRKATV